VSYIQLAGILYATCKYNINTYILFRTLFRQSYRKDLSIRLNSAVALSFKRLLLTWRLLATNVSGSVVPDSGHWIPEERPSFLTEQLFAFFGGNTTNTIK
jgi:hypothetical protein